MSWHKFGSHSHKNSTNKSLCLSQRRLDICTGIWLQHAPCSSFLWSRIRPRNRRWERDKEMWWQCRPAVRPLLLRRWLICSASARRVNRLRKKPWLFFLSFFLFVISFIWIFMDFWLVYVFGCICSWEMY